MNNVNSKSDTSRLDLIPESTKNVTPTDPNQESNSDENISDEDPKNVMIAVDVLNVRVLCSITSDIISQVYEGNIYEVMESVLDTEGKCWYKIDTGDDNIGWIASRYCRDFELEDYTGTYKYKYEYSTEDLIEDHYIVLEVEKGNLVGRYYGTSDEFESFREGYYPGFFVLGMEELKVAANCISFSLVLKENEMFSKPVDIKYEVYNDVPLETNPPWLQTHLSEGYVKYSGIITNDNIILDTEHGSREFLRVVVH